MLSKIRTSYFLKLDRKRIPVFLTLFLLAVIAGGIYYDQVIHQTAQTTATESELQTAVVRQGDLVIYASGTGTLIANSEATFGFKASGQVTKINVKVGDAVKAGQVLAELDNTSALVTYQQAKHTLDDLTSPAAIATAKAAVADAEYDVFTSREDLQYLVSPAVQIWQERLAEDEAILAAVKAEADANPSNEANKKVQEAQDAVTLDLVYLEQAEENYYTYLVNNFSVTETNRRTGRVRIIYYRDENGKRYSEFYGPSETEIAVAQATYDLAKATLEETKIYLAAISGEEIPEGYISSSLVALENARADVITVQQELANTQLIAPITGTIMSLDFNVGDTVSSASTVVTISDLTQPCLEIFLEESDWGNIQLNYEVDVTFDILPDTTFSGKIVQVNPGLYNENNTSVVRAVVKIEDVNGSFNMPLGSTASVEVIGGRAENAVLIPVEALHKAGDQYAVFVMENGELRLRLVEVGIQNAQYAEIISGLEAGDVVSTGIIKTK